MEGFSILSPLTAISPIDGRYHEKCNDVAQYFSEAATIKYRIFVETEYFIALKEAGVERLQTLTPKDIDKIRTIYDLDALAVAQQVKEIEKSTNHDVKAVEYFIKKFFTTIGLDAYKELVHIGLTSQDINNTALPLAFKDCLRNLYIPILKNVVNVLGEKSKEYKNIPMLARTHGQPASPTRMGKELLVFVERLKAQINLLHKIPFSGKFSGATGNFNALHISYPDIDWIAFADTFLASKLGLIRSHPTTQVDHYDNLAAHLDNIKRINTILIDFCQDIWLYISMEYFKQEINAEEVGSSAMPHKINPIDFENAEGNLKVSNALLNFLSDKLPISRLQRDLTDSTVIRNLGVGIAHSTLALKSILKGISKLLINVVAINNDLDKNVAVIAEGIQTLLRKEKINEPYEQLKKLTRTSENITMRDIHEFIDTLAISEALKNELKNIKPNNYTGL